MKRGLFIISIVLFISTVISLFLMNHYHNLYIKGWHLNQKSYNDTFGKDLMNGHYSIPNEGCVRSEMVAINIATILLNTDKDVLLKAENLDSIDAWLVRSQLYDEDIILIKKKDAEILYIGKESDFSYSSFTTNGVMLDETKIVGIAEIILNSLYQTEFTSEMPLLTEYDKETEQFLIKTQLPQKEGYWTLGTVAYIIIKKSNAEVKAVWATT